MTRAEIITDLKSALEVSGDQTATPQTRLGVIRSRVKAAVFELERMGETIVPDSNPLHSPDVAADEVDEDPEDRNATVPPTPFPVDFDDEQAHHTPDDEDETA